MTSLPCRPRDRSGGDPQAVLDYFQTTDGVALGRSLLAEAVAEKEESGVDLALIVCARFATAADIKPLLFELAPAGWHHDHESIVSLLGKLKSPDTVDALYHATQWIPEHLDYDESRALAGKAIWALGAIPGPEATAALTRLLDDKDESLHERAARQLRRRADALTT
ncbi:MAG TPA: HEAT repeat domain-containing protein [Actinocrinis sp.]|nr:HEAT repeat domain-containing protein [Actinocrinis sp.]